jgi:Tol biopolymer transport system component
MHPYFIKIFFAAIAMCLVTYSTNAEVPNLPELDETLSAPITYKDSMVVLTSESGVAAVIFPEEIKDGVKYRYRGLTGDGKEVSGEGEVFEKYKRIPIENSDDVRLENDGGKLVIQAGPCEVQWSLGGKGRCFIYYSPEKMKVQMANARNYKTLDLKRFSGHPAVNEKGLREIDPALFEKRFDEFDAAFDVIREHLTILRRDALAQPAFGKNAGRKGEEGFRAIYTMGPDGKNVELLAGAPGMISNADPQFSHDGKFVAFCAVPELDAVTQSKNYVYALEGPFKGKFRDLSYGNTPAWSPDDKQIAYMLNDTNPANVQGGVWVMNADGLDRRWLGHGWWPRWSSDGKQLVCHGWLDDGRDSLVLIDVATKESRPLLKAPGWTLKMYGGNWSPDGKRIVFCGSFEDQDRVATIDAGGADDSIQILYTNDDPNLQLFGPPAWSPDGKQIVFIKQDTINGGRLWLQSYLYSMNVDPSNEPVLLEGKKVGAINRGMAFSPDGKKLIFSSER